MKPFSIILFSDIHYGCQSFEEQFPVYNAFINDSKKQIEKREGKDIYLFCIGDLVQAGDNPQNYISFHASVIKPILEQGNIPIEHCLFIPGNHDVQRETLSLVKDTHFKNLKELEEELHINQYIEENDNLIKSIFKNFIEFSKDFPKSYWDKCAFLSYDINESWSVGCINSALGTFAHIDNLSDEGNLIISTKPLYEWIERTKTRHRILMMHHPLDSLKFGIKEELKAIIKNHIEIFLTGHTHSHDIIQPLNASTDVISCTLPHLFHSKKDRGMGYCILDFNNMHLLEQMQYREWNLLKSKFVPGCSFTDEEDGVVPILPFNNSKDEFGFIESKLKEDLMASMKIYENAPSINWEERFVSKKRVDQNQTLADEDLFNEDFIIENRDNYVILSPRDYGLTCYGRHFALKLWLERGELSLFIENPNHKISKLSSKIQEDLEKLKTTKDNILWIIVDEWVLEPKQRKEIIGYLQNEFPNAKLLFLSPRLEKYFTDNDEISMFDGFKYLYLTPLKRSQIRSIAKAFNKAKFIAEEDVLLKRLDDDIRTFNMHRSPMNCITLLYVFKNSFEENPVNRTEVLEKVLSIIFDNDETPTYSIIPDQKDCRFTLGKFCAELLKRENHNYSFRQDEFISNINSISQEQMISVDGNYLFSILLRNNIILPYDNYYRFRASYWVYFFGAIQMQNDPSFAKYILEEERYIHFSLIMEFYSGLNRRQNLAVTTVIKDLENIISKVKSTVGLPQDWNPYKMLKYAPSEAQKQRLLSSLENEICGSNLPEEVKDSLADRDYDQRSPFHQNVYKILEEYSVNHLMNIIPIASRTLRNSDYVEASLRKKLFETIIQSWKTLVDTLAMLTPILALKGHVTYGGASFEFVDDISQYSLEQRMLIVLSSLPSNVIRWFEGDLYSNRSAPLYYNYFDENSNLFYKHLIASLILRHLPDKWGVYMSSYLKNLSESSYYLQSAVGEMRNTYSTKVISDEDARRLKALLKEGITRIKTQQSYVSPKHINRIITQDDIPQRKMDEE